MSSEFSTSGRLEIPGIGFSEDFTVEPGSVTRIQLPDTTISDVTASVLTDGQPVAKGIHVTAADPVAVYGLDTFIESSDGYLGLPTSILSTSYLVPSYTTSGFGAVRESSQAAVVSPRDGNTVTITPASPTESGRAAGESFDVTLDAGEAYQIRASGIGDDLTGTVIQSSLPVSVFSGSACTNVPSDFPACDHLIEHIPPTETWGEQFVVSPLEGREAGDTFRILSGDDGTEVTLNGETVTTLGFGDYYETILNSSAVIETSNPALVTQYMNGQEFYEVESGDPFMMMIPPTDQFGVQYAFSTPSEGFARNFVSLMPPGDATESIQLDGSMLGTDFFQLIPSSNFAAGGGSVELGTHAASSTQNAPFGLYSYGDDDFDSYGFTGGLLLEFISEAGGPGIARTEGTIDLSSSGRPEGEPLTIAATITKDEDLPVATATLFHRLEGESEFTARTMTNVSGDRWEADIPERSVQEPGVEYYILASDGQLQSTSPSVDPEGSPYSIAVLPNEPPSIDHTPVQFTPPGEPLTLEASVADNTDQVSTVDLLYRSAGGNPSYTVRAMQEEEGIYSATILGSDVSEQGLEYFVRATDNFGVRATKGTADQPFEVAVIPMNITLAQTPEVPERGSDFTVTATLSEAFTPTETASLYYRQLGGQEFQSTSLETVSQTEYDGTIPGEVVTERGVEYYVRLSDGSTTVTAPAANPTTQPRFTEVQVPSIEAEIELEANQYRMISVPLRLDETDAFSQLQDDFGGLDRTSWRLLRWDPETESYDEVTTEDGTGDLMPGKAYWLITDARENQDGRPTFDVQDGRSPSPETVQIELPPGWTQLANPRPYAVAWSSVSGHESVMAPVAYDPTASDSADFNVDVLQSWRGYWVYNPGQSPVQIKVPSSSAEAAQSSSSAAMGSPDGRETLFKDKPSYALGLTARLEREGKASLHDDHTVMGVADAGQPGVGLEDVAEPPPIGDHLRLSIVEGKTRLAGSLRPAGKEGYAWDLEVSASGAERGQGVVHGELASHGVLPSGFEYRLVDRETGRQIPVEEGAFTVQLTDERPVRRLRLIVGSKAFATAESEAIEPERTGLQAVYPNPSRGAVSVDYQVEAGQRVQIGVYDLLGRRVRTLVDGQRPVGHHTARWDGRSGSGPVASGTYFVRMHAGSTTASRRVVLVR